MRALSTAILLLGLACAPDPEAPVRVMGLAVSRSGALEPHELTLSTVSDVVALEGEVATFRGGARIVFDLNDPLLQTDDALTEAQLSEVFVKSEGLAPRASYIEKSGVLWPADFHTWNLVTAYSHLERAFTYFQAAYDGSTTEALLHAKVYYFPSFVITEQGRKDQVDNALFFSPAGGFALLPFDGLDKVPLALNLGVLGHEYSHRVFNQKTYGGRAFPEPFLRWTSSISGSATPSLNVLKAIDEGFADFHGYGITCGTDLGCDPRFLLPSIDVATTDARDLSKPDKCLTQADKDAIVGLSLNDFIARQLEYKVGTVLAAALYQAGERTGKMTALQKAVVAAYTDPTPQKRGIKELIDLNLTSPDGFTLDQVANAILAHIPELDLRREACNQFLDRLRITCTGVPCAELPDCPSSAVEGTACP